MFQDYKDADTMNLMSSLAGQASRFCSGPRDQKAMTIIVNDWEYLYDTVRHDRYRHSEGKEQNAISVGRSTALLQGLGLSSIFQPVAPYQLCAALRCLIKG
jgi:hypothetical protein